MATWIKNKLGNIRLVADDNLANSLIKSNNFTIPTQDDIDNAKVQKLSNQDIHYFYNHRTSDGYGESGILLGRWFSKLGYSVGRYGTNSKLSLIYLTPDSYIYAKAPIKVAYTMFESTDIPYTWREKIKHFDYVLTPSKFCTEVFSKYHPNVKTIPLGYNHEAFKPVEVDKNGTFTFLHYNAFNTRKGWDLVVKAFIDVFSNMPDVKLILKTIVKPESVASPIMMGLLNKYKNIEIIQEKLSQPELNKLISKSDCFVFPSRGEGYGMTPLEAMAAGSVPIVPNAHGIAEYFNPDCMLDIEAKVGHRPLYRLWPDPNESGYMWDVSLESLKSRMIWAYQNQDEIKLMSKKCVQYVNLYTADKWAKNVYNELNNILKGHYG